MKLNSVKYLLCFISASLFSCEEKTSSPKIVEQDSSKIEKITIQDGFWGPKLKQWSTTSIHDVFDKFEGNYALEWRLGDEYNRTNKRRDAFENFDWVAQGKRDIGKHNGPPWYDGLVYETIRAAGDFLKYYPDTELEKRVDGYIERIAKAQATDKDGFINTYTQLMESDHRWGTKGGFLRWQHDVYNAGMLVEAGVHYYKGTGKTELLEVAVKMVNYMAKEMGPEPKMNIIPAHAGPEEAVIDLYTLFKEQPSLKERLQAPVNKEQYIALVSFWIEGRGQHVGLPDWNAWGNPKSDQWIRDNTYADAKYGTHSRPTFGDYAQDSIPVLEQKTIEGHAVRATLLATGVTALAAQNGDDRYKQTAYLLWNNMVGKRMSINGGVGTIAFDEKFGPDYFLPNDAYLETCAAVGAGFFSEKMNTLTKDGKYIDALERVLYNNILSGVAMDGKHYTYENPLEAEHHHRWDWHDCPCCPPMFLKMMSALPEFIYAVEDKKVYVNLFVQSRAEFQLKGTKVAMQQTTDYPWKEEIEIMVQPDKKEQLAIYIRIPEWARGQENPFGLYQSDFKVRYQLTVNGKEVQTTLENGYAVIRRTWEKQDKIQFTLPLQPRWVKASPKVKEVNQMAVLASGPIIYGIEAADNNMVSELAIDTNIPLSYTFQPNTLNGIGVIKGTGVVDKKEQSFTAIPYYALGNKKPGNAYKVWLPTVEK